MIAVDSSVLIDLLGGDVRRRGVAERACARRWRRARSWSAMSSSSEVVAGLGFGAELFDVLEEAGIRYLADRVRGPRCAPARCSGATSSALKAEGRAPLSARTVPDFLIGAHALLQCSGLITRDAGFFRDYFKGLKVIVPKAA